MFRQLFRQLHSIKIHENELFFPISRITLEKKTEEKNVLPRPKETYINKSKTKKVYVD